MISALRPFLPQPDGSGSSTLAGPELFRMKVLTTGVSHFIVEVPVTG